MSKLKSSAPSGACLGTREWRFPYLSDPGGRSANTMTDPFFATIGVTASLLRELTQNAIDAKRTNVRPRLTLTLRHIPYDVMSKHLDLDGARVHFMVCDWGNEPPPGMTINEADPVTVINIEDNGCGLTGDIEPSPDTNNKSSAQKYLYEVGSGAGARAKSGEKGGRHGIGAEVGAQASGLRIAYAHSTRETDEPKSFACGRASMLNHTYDNRAYLPLGSYSTLRSDNTSGPCTGSDADTVHDLLGFRRGRDEPGLSVSVVCPVPDITRENLIGAALAFLLPQIVWGLVDIEITDARPGDKPTIILSADTLDAVLADPEVRGLLKTCEERNGKHYKILGCIDHVVNLLKHFDEGIVHEGAYDNGNVTFTDETAQAMRDLWESGKMTRFSVEVPLTHKNGERSGRAEVAMMKVDGCKSGYDILVRDSIVIVRRGAEGRFSIARAAGTKDAPNDLAVCLGDCEDPSHINFEAHYGRQRGWTRPGVTATFFAKCAGHAVSALGRKSKRLNAACMAELFPVPEKFRDKKASVVKPDGGNDNGHDCGDFNGSGIDPKSTPPAKPNPNPIDISVSDIHPGGVRFSIRNGVLPKGRSKTLKVEFHYAGDKTGSQRRIYHDSGIKVQDEQMCDSFTVGRKDGKITFDGVRDGFIAHVVGFDTNRDPHFHAWLKENDDDE